MRWTDEWIEFINSLLLRRADIDFSYKMKETLLPTCLNIVCLYSAFIDTDMLPLKPLANDTFLFSCVVYRNNTAGLMWKEVK